MRRPSLFIVIALSLLITWLRLAEMPRHALSWDVFGYYLYLPATFIYDDPQLRDPVWLDRLMEEYQPSETLYQLVEIPDRGRMIKYSMGMAVAYAPFFFIAHTLAIPLGHPADGLSPPYQYAITFGCLIYILIGIFLFRRILLQFFDERWTAILLVLVILGTNFLQLAAWDGTLLTHPFLFTLYALLVLATLEWHRSPRIIWAMAIGLAGGWITLVRPPEIVAMLIPLLWGIHRPSEKVRSWSGHWHHWLIAIAVFAFALSPQLFYWRTMTGEWITNSYANNPGEGFDLLRPHIRPFLISFRKGWFVYTPIMLLALAGIPLLWKNYRALFWPLFLFLIVYVWLAASWTTWWYAGGSFSSRSMLPAYVLLSIPLGVLLRSIQWPVLRQIALVVVGILVTLNLFQTWQWKKGIISKERMTRPYYFAIFGRTSLPAGAEDLLLVERTNETVESFNEDPRYRRKAIFDETYDPPRILNAATAFLAGPELQFNEITSKDYAWIRATATLWVDSLITRSPELVMTFHHDGQTYKYRSMTWDLKPDRSGWQELRMDYLTPEVRSTDDLFKAYIWNIHGDTCAIGSFRVEVFER
jgi:MFS family permease